MGSSINRVLKMKKACFVSLDFGLLYEGFIDQTQKFA